MARGNPPDPVSAAQGRLSLFRWALYSSQIHLFLRTDGHIYFIDDWSRFKCTSSFAFILDQMGFLQEVLFSIFSLFILLRLHWSTFQHPRKYILGGMLLTVMTALLYFIEKHRASVSIMHFAHKCKMGCDPFYLWFRSAPDSMQRNQGTSCHFFEFDEMQTNAQLFWDITWRI